MCARRPAVAAGMAAYRPQAPQPVFGLEGCPPGELLGSFFDRPSPLSTPPHPQQQAATRCSRASRRAWGCLPPRCCPPSRRCASEWCSPGSSSLCAGEGAPCAVTGAPCLCFADTVSTNQPHPHLIDALGAHTTRSQVRQHELLHHLVRHGLPGDGRRRRAARRHRHADRHGRRHEGAGGRKGSQLSAGSRGPGLGWGGWGIVSCTHVFTGCCTPVADEPSEPHFAAHLETHAHARRWASTCGARCATSTRRTQVGSLLAGEGLPATGWR